MIPPSKLRQACRTPCPQPHLIAEAVRGSKLIPSEAHYVKRRLTHREKQHVIRHSAFAAAAGDTRCRQPEGHGGHRRLHAPPRIIASRAARGIAPVPRLRSRPNAAGHRSLKSLKDGKARRKGGRIQR